MTPGKTNVDDGEIRKFDRIHGEWWDRSGTMKSLHDINPLRVGYIRSRVELKGKEVMDIGCGGGILTEALAREGAEVTGIDASEKAVFAARAHAKRIGSPVTYRTATAEEMAEARPGTCDVVTCMELLEHVPSPLSVIRACERLLKPGGEIVFATLNRNPLSYLLAIVCAEYLLGLLPRGTHAYPSFITPNELTALCRSQGLEVRDLRGFSYNPLTRTYHLCQNTLVNYMMHVQKRWF